MAISVEAFRARYNEICTEAEQWVLGALRTMDHRVSVLAEVAADTPLEDQKAMSAYVDERMAQFESNILAGLEK